MTIPIAPGPFSFLAEAGRAAGAIGGAIEHRRDKRRAEAQTKANNYLALRAAGLMSPEEFAKPEVQAVFEAAGFGNPSSTPTSGEQNESTRRQFNAPDQSGFTIPLGDMIPGAAPVTVAPSGPSSVSDERRMTAGLPTRGAIAGEKLSGRRAQAQLDVATTGTPAQQRAVLGTPSATEAQAREDVANDQLFNSLALRAVDAAITQGGGRIQPQQIMALANNAWTMAQEDAKMRGYVADEQFTKPYIMAVIGARIREQRALDIQAEGMRDRGANVYQDYIALLARQQQMSQQQLATLPAPKPGDMAMAATYERKLAESNSPAERQAIENNTMLRQAYDKVQMYNQTVARLQGEIRGYQTQLQGALSNVIPGVSATPPSSEATTLDEPKLNTIVQRLDADPKYADGRLLQTDLQASVQSGELSQADYQKIISRINQRRQSRGLPPIGDAAIRQVLGAEAPPPAPTVQQRLRGAVQSGATPPVSDVLPPPNGGRP